MVKTRKASAEDRSLKSRRLAMQNPRMRRRKEDVEDGQQVDKEPGPTCFTDRWMPCLDLTWAPTRLIPQ